MSDSVTQLFDLLLERYGPQGWWPLRDLNFAETRGYHPGDYSWPTTSLQRFEIGVGAVLTQNTGWIQAEKALANLGQLGCMDPRLLLQADAQAVKNALRCSGYYNQKYKKLRQWAGYFLNPDHADPCREDLLALWGVGPETADSILLYAFSVPVFVVDKYSHRLISRLEDRSTGSYHCLQQYMAAPFADYPVKKKVRIFQEFHALIVAHAKNSCRKQPACESCCLIEICRNSGKWKPGGRQQETR